MKTTDLFDRATAAYNQSKKTESDFSALKTQCVRYAREGGMSRDKSRRVGKLLAESTHSTCEGLNPKSLRQSLSQLKAAVANINHLRTLREAAPKSRHAKLDKEIQAAYTDARKAVSACSKARASESAAFLTTIGEALRLGV